MTDPAGGELAPLLRLTGRRTLELTDEPVPVPGDGDALVRVSAVGLCGSDAHWYLEGRIGEADAGVGLVLGHEIAGVVQSGPRTGERVAVEPAIPCNACEMCQGGRANLCERIRFAGHGDTDGGLRRYLVWPENSLVGLPDVIPDEQGALLEPLGVALHAIDLAGPPADGAVAVVGCGPIGLLLVATLSASGVTRVVATDRHHHRVEAAKRLGAHDVLVVDGIEGPRPEDFDVVFETAGNDEALHAALVAARPGARVVLVGIPEADLFSFTASIARRKELVMLNCRRMLPDDLNRAVSLVAGGGVALEGLVTHRFPLAEAEAAFDTLIQQTGIKVVIQP